MRRRLLLAAVALLAGAVLISVTRPADTPAVPLGDPTKAGLRAMGLISAPLPQEYVIGFEPARPDSPRAELDRDKRTIVVYVRPDDPPHRIAHDLAHELGHAHDLATLTDADRRAYLERRGVPDVAWWPKGAPSDYDTGAGDYAEVYARCHAASPEFRSELAPAPEDACALL
jgi:hypothetical protein